MSKVLSKKKLNNFLKQNYKNEEGYIVKRYKIKLDNLFFHPKKKGLTCDSYLSMYNKQPVIRLEAKYPNSDKNASVILREADLDYLIRYFEMFIQKLAFSDNKKIEFDFGLETSPEFEDSISENNKAYKLLFKYQSHYNGNKKRYPLSLFIKNKDFSNNYTFTDMDEFYKKLLKYKSLIKKLNQNTIEIDGIYDRQKREVVFSNENQNSNYRKSNSSSKKSSKKNYNKKSSKKKTEKKTNSKKQNKKSGSSRNINCFNNNCDNKLTPKEANESISEHSKPYCETCSKEL